MKVTRKQLSEKYGITRSLWERRHDDLLEHLNDFFDIEEFKDPKNGYYYYEVSDELPESVPKLERKSNKEQKINDYREYVKNHLPIEETPLSKAKMTRDALRDFGKKKYKHYSVQNVSRRYVSNAMDEFGEHSDKMVWVNKDNYHLLTIEQEEFLHQCFAEVRLTEREMANAFKKFAQKEDISEEVDNFNKAIDKFKDRYAFRPISVYKWCSKLSEFLTIQNSSNSEVKLSDFVEL